MGSCQLKVTQEGEKQVNGQKILHKVQQSREFHFESKEKLVSHQSLIKKNLTFSHLPQQPKSTPDVMSPKDLNCWEFQVEKLVGDQSLPQSPSVDDQLLTDSPPRQIQRTLQSQADEIRFLSEALEDQAKIFNEQQPSPNTYRNLELKNAFKRSILKSSEYKQSYGSLSNLNKSVRFDDNPQIKYY